MEILDPTRPWIVATDHDDQTTAALVSLTP
jgi:hypothetical protein